MAYVKPISNDFNNYDEKVKKGESPNRLSGNVYDVHSVISNYIDKVPEVNVKFEGNTMIISTSQYGTKSYLTPEQMKADLQNQYSPLIKSIREKLSNNGTTGVSIKFIDCDVNGVGWGTWRQVLYTVKIFYELNF